MYNQLVALLQQLESSNSYDQHNINTSSSSLHHFTHHTTVSFPNHSWILDTGVADHICSSLNLFYSYHGMHPINIKLPNGSIITSNICGTVKLNDHLILHHVLYVSTFTCNLISASQLSANNRCKLVFDHYSCTIQELHSMRTNGLAKILNHLYILNQTPYVPICYHIDSNTVICNIETSNKFRLWHHCRGYPSYNVLKFIQRTEPCVHDIIDSICDCCLAKQVKLTYSLSTIKSTSIFELIPMDIWVPFSPLSIHGHSYFLTVVDDYSRHTWIYLMKSIVEARPLIMRFIPMTQTQFDKHVKHILSDNGQEFLILDYYKSKGILHQRTCVETPQQNAVAECKHRHILNISRAIMFQSRLPKLLWIFAVNHVIYLINRLHSPVANSNTPYQLLHKTPHVYKDVGNSTLMLQNAFSRVLNKPQNAS